MRAITKILAVGVAMAALSAAAPAAAQYYPGYGGGYGYGSPYGYGYGNGGVIGSIINGVTGGYGYNGYNGYNGYGYNVPGGSRIAVSQCSAAVQQRLGGYTYGYGAGAGRVLSINSVEIRSNGGYKVRGVATGGGYGYAGGALSFSCRTDPRGFVTSVDLANGSYGNGYGAYGNYGNYGYNPYDYSQYGYRRY
jgi:hypothetical protein